VPEPLAPKSQSSDGERRAGQVLDRGPAGPVASLTTGYGPREWSGVQGQPTPSWTARGPGMYESEFWAMIEAGGPYDLDDRERQLASVRCQLEKLPAREIYFFYRLFCLGMIDAQTWDLWAAAHLINGGCSEERFVSFRAWLISQGRAIYTAAVESADSLAGVTSPGRRDHEFEALYRLPRTVHFELTRQDVPRLGLTWPYEPGGEQWDFRDRTEVFRRLPRLAAVYLG